nr:MAG TPA: hypothetical protein [Caudoviricetes sp.]
MVHILFCTLVLLHFGSFVHQYYSTSVRFHLSTKVLL